MNDAPLSVKRLLEQIKARIEAPFSAVCVVGEVSNLRTSGKHWYFTLKEEGAALQCAVWAGSQRLLGHTPGDGERVVLRGSLNLYVAGGSLTLAVTHCEKAGVGDLQARLRQLEAELRAEGLFDRPKRPLPRFPKRIGVVAALGGAALRDVLEVCSKRAPGLDLLIAPPRPKGIAAYLKTYPPCRKSRMSTGAAMPSCWCGAAAALRTSGASTIEISCAPSRSVVFPSSRAWGMRLIRLWWISPRIFAPPPPATQRLK